MRTTTASSPPAMIIRLTHDAQSLCARPVFSFNFTTTWRGWFSELLTFTDEETKTQRGKGNLFIVPHREIMEAGFHVQPGFRLLSESLFLIRRYRQVEKIFSTVAIETATLRLSVTLTRPFWGAKACRSGFKREFKREIWDKK